MSKIYEALEQAQKERKPIEQVPEMPAVDIQAVDVREEEIYSLDMEMEEEMLNLYQTVDSLLQPMKKKVIQFIAAGEGEGTSTITREFARVAIMSLGQKVLLLDADRHNPTQHFFCNVSPDYCLDDVVQNGYEADKATYRVGNSSLFVSLISRSSSAAANVFDSSNFDPIWAALREKFDLILIDSPPATTSPEGLAILRRADGVVLIVEADKTRWPVAESVKERIIQHGGNVIGLVLNKRRYHIPEFVYKRL